MLVVLRKARPSTWLLMTYSQPTSSLSHKLLGQKGLLGKEHRVGGLKVDSKGIKGAVSKEEDPSREEGLKGADSSQGAVRSRDDLVIKYLS